MFTFSILILLVAALVAQMYQVSRRAPDFIIGGAANPQIKRWWVIQRNRFGNVYLHHILRSDDDRALHDHPWFNVSIVLRGGYLEVTPAGRYWRGRGSIVFRRATASHRLELPDINQPCWTLFITGPVVRNWGFHCPKRWVPWQEFVDARDTGAVGRGCGE